MRNLRRITFLLSIASLTGCSTPSSQAPYRTLYVYAFDSVTKIVYASDTDYDSVLDDLVTGISRVADPYTVPSSGGPTTLYDVNADPETPVLVGEDLLALLTTSMDLMTRTNGYYNPFVGTLTKIWKYYLFGGLDPVQGWEARLPSDKLIGEGLAEIASTSLEISGNTVIKHGKADLDLGAIAKGYALDQIVAFFQEKNITQYVVNAGNSSVAVGKSSKGGPITVGLQYVKDPYQVRVQDATTAVSGIYEQSAVVDGVTYTHVVNPKTGKALVGHSLAFLSHSSGAISDALSTAALCMPLEDAKALEADFGVKMAIFDQEEGQEVDPQLLYETEGFRS